MLWRRHVALLLLLNDVRSETISGGMHGFVMTCRSLNRSSFVAVIGIIVVLSVARIDTS